MPTQKAEIALGFDVKKFLEGTEKAIRGSKKFVDRLEQQKQKLRGISIKATATLAAELFAVKKLTDAYGRQELAEKKLKSAIDNVVTARDGEEKALIKQAAALQKLTGFQDEEIINAQAMLATFQLNGKQIEAITPRLLDMAAGVEKLTGEQVDLQQLSVALGKGFTGMVGSLSRYGVVLSEDTVKTGDFSKIIRDLDLNFKGFAEGSADTLVGKQKILSAQMGDLAEVVGKALAPAMLKLIERAVPLIEKSAAWIEQNQKLVAIIAGLGIGGTGLLAALSTMGFLLAGLPALFAAVTGPLGLVVIGVVALAGAIAWFASNKEEVPKTLEGLNDAIGKNQKRMEELKKTLGDVALAEAEYEAASRDATVAMRDQGIVIRSDALAEYKKLETVTGQLTEARDQLTEQEKREAAAREISRKMGAKALAGESTESEKLIESINKRVAARKLEAEHFARFQPSGFVGPMDPEGGIQGIIDKIPELARATEDAGDAVKSNLLEPVEQLAMAWGTGIDEVESDLQAFSDFTAATFASTFTAIEKLEKNFLKAVGKALVATIAKVIRAVVGQMIIEALATKIKEITKATIEAPGTFGASLLRIPLIVAAAGAGIAALNSLAAKAAEKTGGSFQTGGILPETGAFYGHRREIVYNPDRNTLGDFAGWLREVAPGQAAGIGSGGGVNVNWNHYGPLSTKIDIEEAGRSIAQMIRDAWTSPEV